MSMEKLRTFYLRQLQSQRGGIANEMTRVRYLSLQAREAWHPAINAYRCRDCVLICAEVAGVGRSQIAVTVPAEAKRKIEFTPVENVDEALGAALARNLKPARLGKPILGARGMKPLVRRSIHSPARPGITGTKTRP